MITLEQLREEWAHVIADKGGHCKVCDRFGKISKRSINRSMAQSLVWLVNSATKDEDGWVFVPSGPHSVVRTNQLSTLKHWGVIERKPHAPDKTKHSGFWRPTQLGISFVRGEIALPHDSYTYNDNLLRLDGPPVRISDCFETAFDYQQVMRSRYSEVAWETPHLFGGS